MPRENPVSGWIRRTACAVVVAGISSVGAAAPIFFSGYDAAGTPHPNSDAARASFLAAAGAVATQNFEGIAAGPVPANIPFGSVNGAFTDLAQPGGQANADFSQIKEGVGSFNEAPISAPRFLNSLADAGRDYFTITFDRPVVALGFYLSDVSDWSGFVAVNNQKIPNVQIRLNGPGGSVTRDLLEGVDPGANPDGNTGFFGFVDFDNPITSFTIVNPLYDVLNSADEDGIGLDDIMVRAVPLPGSAALLAMGCGLLCLRRRRLTVQ